MTILDPESLNFILVARYASPPSATVKALKDALVINAYNTHLFLKAESPEIILSHGGSIEAFVDMHSTLRGRMIAANHVNIQYEAGTLNLMFDGLQDNPEFSVLDRTAKFTGAPSSMASLHVCLQDV